MIKLINLVKIFLNYAHVSYIHHFTNWNVQFWFFFCHYPPRYLRYRHNNKKICASLTWSPWTLTSTVSKEMNNLSRLARIWTGNWAAACYSCGWFYPMTDSSSCDGIRVASDSILRLTWVLATGYELRLILSRSWLELRRLDTSCSWLYPAADSSFGCWMRVAADSILRLTWVPAAE